jgi:hypothetical protein
VELGAQAMNSAGTSGGRTTPLVDAGSDAVLESPRRCTTFFTGNYHRLAEDWKSKTGFVVFFAFVADVGGG